MSGAFSRTTSGSGSGSLDEGGSLASTSYNATPSTHFLVTETGNYLSGALSFAESGTDRYSLIEGFTNVSNVVSSNGPGAIDFSPVGAPYHVGASPYWGHGPAANLDANAADAAFDELGLQLLHEYCWAGDQPLMANFEDDRRIDASRKGQLVLTASEHDPEGPRYLGEVGAYFENGCKHVINLYVEGRLFRPTPNHPIYVRERGFVPAGELKPGDELLTSDHRWVRVSSIVDKDEVVPVFNLMVPNGHTYFVGSNCREGFSILVHNASEGGGRASKQIEAARKNPASPLDVLKWFGMKWMTGGAVLDAANGTLQQAEDTGETLGNVVGVNIEAQRAHNENRMGAMANRGGENNQLSAHSATQKLDDPAKKTLKGAAEFAAGQYAATFDSAIPGEAQIDHIVPRIGPDGKPLGTNSYSNARVISAEYNNFLLNKK